VNLTAHPAADLRPAWSPDGKWIAFASDRDGGWRLYRVPASGGAVEQVTQYKIENTFFDWSPVIDLPWRSGWNVLGAALILGLWAFLRTVSKAALPQTAL
jgi:hypothetical protein